MSCTITVKVAVAVLGGTPSSMARILIYKENNINKVNYCEQKHARDFSLLTYLMPWIFFSIQSPLNCYSSILSNGKLPLAIGRTVDLVRHFAFTTLIWVSCFKCFQSFSNFNIFINGDFNVRFFKNWPVIFGIKLNIENCHSQLQVNFARKWNICY